MIPLPHINRRRTWIIIAAIATIAVLAGLYTWWSMQVWRQYDGSWHATQSLVKRDITKAISTTPASEKEYTEKRNALRAVVDTLKAHEHMCATNTFVSWQKTLRSVDASVKACEAMQAKHRTLQSALTRVATYLNDEQTLQKELVKLMPTKASSLDEKHWAPYATAVTEVQKKLSTLQLGDDSAPVLSATKKQLTTLATAWKAFNEAHKKEDRSAWQKAKGDLVRAYAGMPAIADASDKTLETLLKQLSAAGHGL